MNKDKLLGYPSAHCLVTASRSQVTDKRRCMIRKLITIVEINSKAVHNFSNSRAVCPAVAMLGRWQMLAVGLLVQSIGGESVREPLNA